MPPKPLESATTPERSDWIVVRHDPESGIEVIRAHFRGHAYDPHDHDEFLLGFTESGVQQFSCRRRVHRSTPGGAILIEPGEVHDGESPETGGFTYGMLYVPMSRMRSEVESLGIALPGFRATLSDDNRVTAVIRRAFSAIYHHEGRLSRDLSMSILVCTLQRVSLARMGGGLGPAVQRAQDLIHEEFVRDLSLADLCAASGLDRFGLARAFRQEVGLSPHAYLVQTRLKAARRALSRGVPAAAVAAETGFVDQSHLGRWFRRAYRLTPAAYARVCTSVPD